MSHTVRLDLEQNAKPSDPFSAVERNRWFLAEYQKDDVPLSRLVYISREVSQPTEICKYGIPEVIFIDLASGTISHATYKYLTEHYLPVPGFHQIVMTITQ